MPVSDDSSLLSFNTDFVIEYLFEEIQLAPDGVQLSSMFEADKDRRGYRLWKRNLP